MNEKLKNFLKKFIKVTGYDSGKGYHSRLYKFGFFTYEKKLIPKLKAFDKSYSKNPKVYLSVVCIAKNEAPYIKEWIEYHKMVGVERFYFYDNGSTDNTREILEPYINDGTVIYDYCEGKRIQISVYTDAIVKYKNQTRWMAMIDLDEFIVPTEKDNIQDFLKSYEKYPAVGINWVMFDSNGHQTRPLSEGGLVTANYTRVMKNYNDKFNWHIKSIVNPKEVVYIYNPHFAIYRNDKLAVTENYEEINGPYTKYHSSEKIRINHYRSKSVEECLQKIDRGRATVDGKWKYHDLRINFHNYTYDYAIQKYLPELKKRMNIKEDKVL